MVVKACCQYTLVLKLFPNYNHCSISTIINIYIYIYLHFKYAVLKINDIYFIWFRYAINIKFHRPRSKFLPPLKMLLLFSLKIMSGSLQHQWLQHTRYPCPSPSPGVCSNSCPSSWWCHPTVSSSVIPFSSCPQSFPASGYFWKSPLFASGGQSIGASASVLPMNIQGWFPLGLTGLNFLLSKELSSLLKYHS